MPQRSKFLGYFGSPNMSKFSILTILLKSFPWIHNSLALCARRSYFQICVQYGPQRPNFGAPNRSKFWSLVIFSKSFHRFHISIVSYAHCKRCVEYGTQMPNFVAILGPKISQHSGLWSFNQKVFTCFTSVLLHILTASTFRGVENMGLKGSIFGPLWAPE